MAVISKDLGAVTAYAAAVNRGYTGTKEEFETLMASYATVAEQAAESAQSAGQSATNASQSAQTAETAKGTAQQAATDAQTAQASAQESAQSAQQSAQSASQSAQTAESAKETAVDAVDGFAAGAQQALDSVNQAGVNWKSLAQAKALDSEAYALGTRDGEDVGSSDPAYHNNAKYYAESISTSAQTASDAAQTATQKAGDAQASAEAAAESARTLTIDSTLTQAGQAADAEATGGRINVLCSKTNNLFDKFNADIAELVPSGTTTFQQSLARSVIVPLTVTDQTNVTITKTIPSSRFNVAKYTEYPAVGIAPQVNPSSDNSATSITVSVNAETRYLLVFLYNTQIDTLSLKEVLSGLMVEYGGAFTKYVEPYEPINQKQLDNLELATTDAATENVTLSFENATGYYNKNGGFSTYSGATTAKVSVVPYDRYLLTTRNYYNAAVAVFFDANDGFVSGLFIANNTSPLTDLPVTVPANASYMLIQRVYNYSPTLLKKITGITNKPVKSILNGKNVTLIGDSITEKNSTANINWALWMYDWCGANVQNLGASGTGFIAGNANPYHNRISRISNPDIIGIALSFNDMSNTIEDLTTAAETFFDDLITAYPATPIICYVQSPWSAYRPGVEKSDQWIAALRNVCVTRGVPFYDEMYYGSALRPWLSGNRSVYYMHDGEGSDGAEDWVHPNSEGHKVIARHLYPLFEKNVVTTGLSCVIGD